MYKQSKINVPALGMACAAALALTIGVPLAMQHGVDRQAVLAPHTDPGVTQVATGGDAATVAPNTIEVVVVAPRQQRSWWSEVMHKRTT